MSRVSPVLLFLLLWLPPALAGDLPPALQPFGIVATRNIFDPNRRASSSEPSPTREPAAEPLVPPPPPETTTLAGVAILDGVATAIFYGSSPELSGTRHVGDLVGGLKIIGMDTDGVSLVDGAEARQLSVGTVLERRRGEGWELGTVRTPPIPASPIDAGTGPDTASAADAAAADILKRLKERRQQELGK